MKPCTIPCCRNLVESGRCKEHSASRTESHRAYDRTWSRLSNMKLRRNPVCEIQTHCGVGVQSVTFLDVHLNRVYGMAGGFGAPAREVDHIIPIRERPDLRLVWSNLQSACKRCHSAKTMRETG